MDERKTQQPDTQNEQPGLADRIRDAIDRMGEWVDFLLNPPVPVPIPVRVHPVDQRRR